MANIEIRDESTHNETRFQLYVGGSPRALITKKKKGSAQFHWQIYGPQYWPDAQAMIQGLLELSVIADQLSGEK